MQSDEDIVSSCCHVGIQGIIIYTSCAYKSQSHDRKADPATEAGHSAFKHNRIPSLCVYVAIVFLFFWVGGLRGRSFLFGRGRAGVQGSQLQNICFIKLICPRGNLDSSCLRLYLFEVTL